ncbi:MAG: hypothetical protein HY964_04880 [Ignavibacteriales bacterium]|nr:hypothetical protein [Ignavibacteriales bacterium]
MKKICYASIMLLIALTLLTTLLLPAGERINSKDKKQLYKPSEITTKGDYVIFDANNISTYIRNNGSFNRDPGTGNSGFEWPKGTGNTAIYASGIWLGGLVNELPRVAVAEYSYEFDAGPIATGVNPDDSRWKVYKIKRGDNASTNSDYANWPIEDGAPFSYDGDGNKVPKVIGDMTIFAVFNDNNPLVHVNMNTEPLGIEVQLTAFAFNRSDALGNTIYYKWKLINKGGRDIRDAYVTVWADPDLGDSGDDYDGCDTTLGIGFTYNSDAHDGVYGDAPPATGFDFLQGPLVPGAPTDTAKFPSGRIVPGYKFLKMTSYLKYNNDNSDLGNPSTGQEVYNYMRGLTRTAQPIFNNRGIATPFMFPGDPNFDTSATNWIESEGGGDRRFMMSAGPFNMAPGDTQEIVAGNLIAQGSDYHNSVTALKKADEVVQLAYNLDFNLAPPPPAPEVNGIALDNSIVLDWAENGKLADEIENFSAVDPLAATAGIADSIYYFEGYVVYQVANASGDDPRLIMTFDVINGIKEINDEVFDPGYGLITKTVKFGSDRGVVRSIRLIQDKFSGGKFANNKDYYFLVTSYSYNPGSIPKTLESSKNILTIRPTKSPGERFTVSYGDTVVATHIGAGDGSVLAIVVDPSKVTGDDYMVVFKPDTVDGGYFWDLIDVTKNNIVLANQKHQTVDGDGSYATIDGLMVKVLGPKPGMKDYSIPAGTRRWTFAGGAGGWAMEGFSGAIGWGGGEWTNSFGYSSIQPTQLANVLIKFAATDSNGVFSPSDTIASYGYRYLRRATLAPAKPEFAPFILNSSGGYAFQIFEKNMPISAYNMETNPPTRLMLGFLENNVSAIDETHPYGGMVDGRYWPPFYGSGDNTASTGPREWFFVFNVPYSETMNPTLAVDILNTELPIMWFGTPARRQDAGWPGGDEFLIIMNRINTQVDTFTFTAPKVLRSEDYSKADIENIMAVPNPYFGANAYEQNQFGRIIRFTNLPKTATIRIFNLASDLVRELTKDDNLTTFDWDLRNKNNLPVASGMYIIHIEMPGIGEKILKVAVIMAEERLDNF